VAERFTEPPNETVLQDLIAAAKRLTKNKKQTKMQEAVDFIVSLFQSSSDRIEKS